MLTGCRLGEIITLKWDYVDIKARELRLPDSKTGAKIVHFGKMACDVLKGIKKLEENPYVITGKKEGSRLTDLQHPWRRIRAKAGTGKSTRSIFFAPVSTMAKDFFGGISLLLFIGYLPEAYNRLAA